MFESTKYIHNYQNQRSQIEAITCYLVWKLGKAIDCYDKAIENNEKLKSILDQFIGKSETFELTNNGYFEWKIPKSVLRRLINQNYMPTNAAMSLVLRAGIEKGSKATFELIRECVKKINKSC